MFRKKPEPTEFENLIKNAKRIVEIDPRGLQTYIYAILRPFQSEQIIQVCEKNDHSGKARIDGDTFFSSNNNFFSYEEKKLSRVANDNAVIDLAKDLVLPTPWHPLSLASCFTSFTNDRNGGPWREDNNHSVELWLPWRIGFVNGGNHSITAGILRSEGSIKPSYVFDLSEKIKQVKTDGINFISVETNKVICPVQNQRVAAVWEIGRMMLEST